MTTSSSARAQTLAAMEAAHDALMAALGGLPDAAVERPFEGAWSLKDMLAHLAAWDEIGAGDVARIARGHAPLLGSFRSEEVDEWNDYAVRRRRHFSPAQTIAELEYGWRALASATASLPDAAFAEGQMARMFCDLDVRHKTAHAREVRAWRDQHGL